MNVETVKVSTESELRESLAVRRAVFIVEQGVPESVEVDEWDALGAARHVLIREAGRAVATGRFRRYDDRTAKLQRIAVLQEGRGQGFGQRVVTALEACAKEEGYEAVILDAQCHAEGFYKRLGYRTVSPEPFLEEGILHVLMRKEL